MYPHDWRSFLEHGTGRDLWIAQVDSQLAEKVGAASSRVYLGHACAVKEIEKHDLTPDHFPMIFETLDYGTIIADRDRHLTFLHFDQFEWEGGFR